MKLLCPIGVAEDTNLKQLHIAHFLTVQASAAGPGVYDIGGKTRHARPFRCAGADQIVDAIGRGARGYIPTSVPLEIVVEVIRLVRAGGVFVPATSLIAARRSSGFITASQQSGGGLFTARQAAVVEALRRGKANKIIAYELNMRESTMKVQIRNIMKQLKARNRTEVSHAHPEILKPLGGSPKRAIDVAIALAVILLLSPLMLMIMGLIKLTIGGSIFSVHSRIGHRGAQFRCYKFRTMADAEEMFARHLADDPHAAQERRASGKLRNDPRVTFFGQLLRKSSLDEIPQLINVLRGEMSCVGPWPIAADELQHYGPNAAEYLKARPGLTGMWHVSGRNALDYADRVALDCHYIRNWSLWTDLVILGRTIFAVMEL